MTIEQKRHTEILSRLDTLTAAVVALGEALRSIAEDEEGEEEEYTYEGVRPVRMWDGEIGDVVFATMEDDNHDI